MDRFQVIESFVRVAEAGSFTRAAMQLGLSRALISRRIMDLETRLGVRLFNRSTRSVGLTAEGRSYLARCKRVLDDMETAEREIAGAGTTAFGAVSILAPKSFGVIWLSDAMIAFSRAHPQIRVSLMLSIPSLGSIACVLKVVGTFLWAECGHEGRSCVRDTNGSLGRFSEMRLEFAERHLDRIEIRGIFWKIAQRCARGFDRLLNAGNLMNREAVHHHDVAALEGGARHRLR